MNDLSNLKLFYLGSPSMRPSESGQECVTKRDRHKGIFDQQN